MDERRFDVVVLGAGPAGCATAIGLRRLGLSVLLIDARERATAPAAVGENLPPAAWPRLHAMGLTAQVGAHYLPSRGVCSVWGGERRQWQDYLYSPYGSGLLLDRRWFDLALLERARDSGAELKLSCTLLVAQHAGSKWTLGLRTGNGELTALSCNLVIAATGRAAGFVQGQGAHRIRQDRTIAQVLVVDDEEVANLAAHACIEACATGWWYSAPLPGAQRVIMLLSDVDLALDAPGWHAAQARTQLLREFARSSCAALQPRTYAANSTRLSQSTGAGWLAVGDAAQAYDPLASAGLMKALVHGQLAAQTAAAHLDGDVHAMPAYQAVLDQAWTDYMTGLARIYGMERRWSQQPFWRRRQLAAHAVVA